MLNKEQLSDSTREHANSGNSWAKAPEVDSEVDSVLRRRPNHLYYSLRDALGKLIRRYDCEIPILAHRDAGDPLSKSYVTTICSIFVSSKDPERVHPVTTARESDDRNRADMIHDLLTTGVLPHPEVNGYYQVEACENSKLGMSSSLQVYHDYQTVADHMAQLRKITKDLVNLETRKGVGLVLPDHPNWAENFMDWLTELSCKAYENSHTKSRSFQVISFIDQNGRQKSIYLQLHTIKAQTDLYPSYQWLEITDWSGKVIREMLNPNTYTLMEALFSGSTQVVNPGELTNLHGKRIKKPTSKINEINAIFKRVAAGGNSYDSYEIGNMVMSHRGKGIKLNPNLEIELEARFS